MREFDMQCKLDKSILDVQNSQEKLKLEKERHDVTQNKLKEVRADLQKEAIGHRCVKKELNTLKQLHSRCDNFNIVQAAEVKTLKADIAKLNKVTTELKSERTDLLKQTERLQILARELKWTSDRNKDELEHWSDLFYKLLSKYHRGSQKLHDQLEKEWMRENPTKANKHKYLVTPDFTKPLEVDVNGMCVGNRR